MADDIPGFSPPQAYELTIFPIQFIEEHGIEITVSMVTNEWRTGHWTIQISATIMDRGIIYELNQLIRPIRKYDDKGQETHADWGWASNPWPRTKPRGKAADDYAKWVQWAVIHELYTRFGFTTEKLSRIDRWLVWEREVVRANIAYVRAQQDVHERRRALNKIIAEIPPPLD